jgi:hypothetical protein
MLRSGVLDGICRDAKPDMPDAAFELVAEQMLVVLAHLFGRMPLHRAILLQPDRIQSSPSKARTLPDRVPAEASSQRQSAAGTQVYVS